MNLVISKSTDIITNVQNTNFLSEREAEMYSVATVPIPGALVPLFRVLIRAKKLKFLDAHVCYLSGAPVSASAMVGPNAFELSNDSEVARTFDPEFSGSACQFLFERYFPDQQYPMFPNWEPMRVYWLEKWYSLIENPEIRKVFWAYAYGGFGTIIEAVRGLSTETKTSILTSEVFTAQDKTYLSNIGGV